jgi:hypothetical protein
MKEVISIFEKLSRNPEGCRMRHEARGGKGEEKRDIK